jgi:hypothetical protein
LAERGYWLAQVSERDLVDLTFERDRAREQGKYRPGYEEGEFVAVNSLGHVYSLNKLTTGDSRAEVADFLRPLEGKDGSIKDVTATRQEFAYDWQHEREDRNAAAVIRGVGGADDTIRAGAEAARGVVAGVGAILDVGATVAEKALDSLAKAGEAILKLGDGFGAAKDTPEQRRHKIENVQARAAEREAEAIDLRRYLNDEQYRQQVAEQREEQERRDREREREISDKDRDRGGRDR